jgi:hypothetical protein
MKFGKRNSKRLAFPGHKDGSKVQHSPSSGPLTALINARKTEHYVHNRPIGAVSDIKVNHMIWQVNEPSNDLGGLSLVSFPPITQENSEP